MPLSGLMRSEGVDVDVAIIGAGPAGSVAALLLARAGLRVVMMRRDRGERFQVGEGLPPAVRPLLAGLGLHDVVERGGHFVSHGNRSAWGSDELISTDFIFSPLGHGWHLDRPAFNRALADAAVAAGAMLLDDTTLERSTREERGWHLETHRGDVPASLSAQIVLDCSGRRAVFARSLGVKRLYYDRLIAVVRLFRSEGGEDRDSTTMIEAVSDGWWYTALLPGPQRIVVFLTDGDLVDVADVKTDDGWGKRFDRTRHTRGIVERHAYTPTGLPWIEAADSSRLESLSGDGWIAAGDAAAAFDPLSSQGIMTAMAAGRRAAEALLAARAGDADAIASYTARLSDAYDEYLRGRAYYYSEETRWPEELFWKRRQIEEDVLRGSTR